jgi:hypothetical protein
VRILPPDTALLMAPMVAMARRQHRKRLDPESISEPEPDSEKENLPPAKRLETMPTLLPSSNLLPRQVPILRLHQPLTSSTSISRLQVSAWRLIVSICKLGR